MTNKNGSQKTRNFKNCLGVFQGGGCKAIAFVGAYEEAKKRGVNFSELAGTSAGSIFAALIAAGATPEYLNNLVTSIDFNRFNSPVDKNISGRYGFKGFGTSRKLVRALSSNKVLLSLLDVLDNIGLYSSEEIESWLNNELKKLLNIDTEVVTFKDLKLPLHVIATDLNKQQQIVWNLDKNPDYSVSHAVRCSCTIPLYFQPVDMSYLDGGLVSNLPSFSLNDGEGHFEKILCFTLSSKAENIKCLNSYIGSVIGAVIDGAIQIQEMLQNNTYNIEIKDLPITTTGFDSIDEKLIESTLNKGKIAADNFFNQEIIKIGESNKGIQAKLTKDYILNSVVMEDVNSYSHIYLCFHDTKLVYSLFPTILSWLMTKNIRITFITQAIESSSLKPKEIVHERYRRLLIKKFGIQLIERDIVPFDAFIFKGEYSHPDKAVFLYSKAELELNVGHGAIYDGKHDLHVINALLAMLNLSNEERAEHSIIINELKTFSIEKLSSDYHIKELSDVPQYKNHKVTLTEEIIDIDKVKLMTKYVKSYKYHQIEKLHETLSNYSISIDEPCVIRFSDNLSFLVSPLIVEQHGEHYIVIKGNSRLSYAYRELGLNKSFKAIVAKNVNIELPSIGSYPVFDCIITTKNKQGITRYEDWTYSAFRNIEESMRKPHKYLEEV
jgi:predicted acylesterase/phospholipase RssA